MFFGLTSLPKLTKAQCGLDKVNYDISTTLNRAQSPNGLSWVYQWGSARYASNLAFFMSVAQKYGYCDADCWNFINLQLNYVLGDGTGHTLVVGGPGKNPPKNPHHSS